MAIVDLRHSDITLKDGAANSFYLKVGEGTLSYTEARPLKYTTDKGRIDEIMLETPVPLDVKFDVTWMQVGAPYTNHFADGTKQTVTLLADHFSGILEGGLLYSEAVVSISQVAGLATVVDPNHGIVGSGSVTIRGAAQANYNGVKAVTVVSTSSYTFAVDSGTVTPATGTIAAVKLAATYVSSDPDLVRPHACDIEIKYLTGDGTSETTILLPDFRFESKSFDLSGGKASITGKCFSTEALITEAAV